MPQSFEDRVKAIDVAVRYQDASQSVLDGANELTEALRTNVSRQSRLMTPARCWPVAAQS